MQLLFCVSWLHFLGTTKTLTVVVQIKVLCHPFTNITSHTVLQRTYSNGYPTCHILHTHVSHLESSTPSIPSLGMKPFIPFILFEQSSDDLTQKGASYAGPELPAQYFYSRLSFACLMAAINNAIRRSTNVAGVRNARRPEFIASCMSVAGRLMLAAEKNEHFSVLIVHRPR